MTPIAMHVLQLLVQSGKCRVHQRKAHILSLGAKTAKLKQADKRMKKKKKKKKQADHSSQLISMPSVKRRRRKKRDKKRAKTILKICPNKSGESFNSTSANKQPTGKMDGSLHCQ